MIIWQFWSIADCELLTLDSTPWYVLVVNYIIFRTWPGFYFLFVDWHYIVEAWVVEIVQGCPIFVLPDIHLNIPLINIKYHEQQWSRYVSLRDTWLNYRNVPLRDTWLNYRNVITFNTSDETCCCWRYNPKHQTIHSKLSLSFLRLRS